MKVEVPYGGGRVHVVIDDARFAGAVHAAGVVCADERELLARALSHPLGAPTLDAFLDGVLNVHQGGVMHRPRATVHAASTLGT